MSKLVEGAIELRLVDGDACSQGFIVESCQRGSRRGGDGT